jgi:hypothetical protein
VAESGEHGRGNQNFSKHMESPSYNRLATITNREIPV